MAQSQRISLMRIYRTSLKRFIPFLFLLLFSLAGRAQLRSVGPLPQDFRMSVQELYDSDMQRAKKYAGGRVRNKQQVLEASYRVNRLLASGHIVYGDPISKLVERIADTLLKDYPELRSELRFYTVTSPEVNAFTTGQGMIMVSTGLMAQVENEAQLAFILSHEIVHYYKSHTLEEIVGRNKRSSRSVEVEDAGERENTFMGRHQRSREMENEADSLGIALFYVKSPYSSSVGEGVFDVLQYSYLPFDEIPFDTTWFNTPYFKLTGCWIDTVADITSRDNYDDSRSTHPNILSRRRKVAEAMDGRYGGEEYVVSTPAEFAAIRQMARKETIRQEIIHGHFAHAFYNTWLLLREAPNDAELHLMVAQELYGIAKYNSHDKKERAVGDYKKVEGESQQVHYFFSNITADMATVVALRKIWLIHQRFPSEEVYEKMAADLMAELRLVHEKSSRDYLSELPKTDSISTTDTAANTKPTTGKSKYERIKEKRVTQTRRLPTAYALTDILRADPSFATKLREHLSGTAEAAVSDTSSATGTLIFDPNYYVVESSTDEQKILESSQCEEAMVERINSVGSKFDITHADFSDAGMHRMQTSDEYNDFLSVCEWMNEFWQTRGNFTMIQSTQPLMKDLLDRYQASNITTTAVLNTEGTEADASARQLIYVPLIPVVVAGMLTGIENTAMATVVIDARRDKILTKQSYNFNVADHGALVDAMLYDTYIRTIRPEKKTPTGYQGKHFALLAGVNLSPSGLQPMKQLKKYVAVSPWAAVEVAIKRSFSLTIWGSYQKAYEDVVRTETTVEYTPQENVARYKTYPNSPNILTLGMGGHRFFKSEFAPYGPYFNFGVHVDQMTIAEQDEALYSGGVYLGLGRSYLFFHTLLLNWEINYAYSYGLTKGFGSNDDEIYMPYDDEIYMPYKDNFISHLLSFRLGIGILPF